MRDIVVLADLEEPITAVRIIGSIESRFIGQWNL